jgi:hypothetical protein
MPQSHLATWGAPRCGELSTGEYHAQYERGSGWVWTGGLEARQGVGTQDGGSPLYYLETNSKPSSISTEFGAGAQHTDQ